MLDFILVSGQFMNFSICLLAISSLANDHLEMPRVWYHTSCWPPAAARPRNDVHRSFQFVSLPDMARLQLQVQWCWVFRTIKLVAISLFMVCLLLDSSDCELCTFNGVNENWNPSCRHLWTSGGKIALYFVSCHASHPVVAKLRSAKVHDNSYSLTAPSTKSKSFP